MNHSFISWSLVEYHLSKSLNISIWWNYYILVISLFLKRKNIAHFKKSFIIEIEEWFPEVNDTWWCWVPVSWICGGESWNGWVKNAFIWCYFILWKAHKFHGTNIIYYWGEDGSDVEAETETWTRTAEEGKADDGSFHQCWGTVPFSVSVLLLHPTLLIRDPSHIPLFRSRRISWEIKTSFQKVIYHFYKCVIFKGNEGKANSMCLNW